IVFFFFQAEDGIRDKLVTGVQTCALPISFRPKNSTRLWTCLHFHATMWRKERPTSGPEISCSSCSTTLDTRPFFKGPTITSSSRSEERRVGKECRCRWARKQEKIE